MQMHSLKAIPITLEDRTAAITNTDFDDMYDRVFFQVVRNPGDTVTKIYEMHVRASRQRHGAPVRNGEPVITLSFLPDETLGTISFCKLRMSMPMNQFLRKMSFFGSYVAYHLGDEAVITHTHCLLFSLGLVCLGL